VKKIITIIVAFLFLAGFSLQAQGINIGLSGGLHMIQSPDQFTKDISEGGLGFGPGIQLGAKGKFSLPVIPLRVTSFVNYTMFSGDGTFNNQKIETDFSIITVGFGGEWSLVPGPVSPYLAVDILYNRFGEVTMKNTTTNMEQKNDGVSRSGVGIGGGLEVSILPMLDVDVSAKYNLNNLVGKEDGEESVNSLSILLNVYLSLL
jgi:hypothetical protein